MIAAIDPVMKLAADQGAPALLGIASTFLFLAAYLGWVVWAYLPSHRTTWEARGLIPFDDDELAGGDQ